MAPHKTRPLAAIDTSGSPDEPCPIHHTPEFEGADYSLESMVRKFVKAPVLAYRPKKGGETDPEIAPILARGMRYVAEFTSAEGGAGRSRAGGLRDRRSVLPVDPSSERERIPRGRRRAKSEGRGLGDATNRRSRPTAPCLSITRAPENLHLGQHPVVV